MATPTLKYVAPTTPEANLAFAPEPVVIYDVPSGGGDVTTAQLNAALALKANIASPSLTGTPLAPTAAVATNTTQIATTAFVRTSAGAAKTQIVALAAVTAANGAPAVGDPPTKAEFDALVTLANANKAAINAIIAALKA